VRRLDFVIAGVQKGGTTALHRYLRAHTQVFVPAQKELHFFDDEGVDWRAPDYAQLLHHFAAALPEQMCGEATPIYTYWPPALERIARHNPGIRIIVLLRDPVERAYSHWVMERSRGNEDLPFAQAIRSGRSRVLPMSEAMRVYSYVERGFYADQIRRLLHLFEANQVLFVATTQLRGNHAGTLAKVCRFLGIAPFTTPPSQEIIRPVEMHPQVPMTDEDRAFLKTVYGEDIRSVARLTGIDFGSA
jgi:hypothetical protein